MNDVQPPPNRLRVLRWTRVFAQPLRETFPVDETPAAEMMDFLEQADRKRYSRQPGDNA